MNNWIKVVTVLAVLVLGFCIGALTEKVVTFMKGDSQVTDISKPTGKYLGIIIATDRIRADFDQLGYDDQITEEIVSGSLAALRAQAMALHCFYEARIIRTEIAKDSQ